jgi:N-methylhydantoinase A
MSETQSGWIVGVDVGGTFTDVLLAPLDGSGTVLAKVATSPDPADGVVEGVREAARRAGLPPEAIEHVLHGTTIATNTVVQGHGARVGLLVTAGFRYVLEIARSWTPGPISGWMVWDRPAALADVRDTRELAGRIAASGELLTPLDEDEIRTAVSDLASRGVEALTVALLNGYARPDVEARVGSIASDVAPGLPISLASDVLPEFREYERTLAGVANAYVQPAMRSYLGSLEESLRCHLPRATLSIVRSDGGLASAHDAAARPIETVLSGPAGGVRAAVFLGQLLGYPDVLSFDMGGTSTDVALSREGHAPVSRTSALTDYFRVRIPSLDVIAIGAGGGSLAHVPETGALRVGPDSAGASPGPACYGRGGEEPTVTDANVVLGYLPALLGGRMPLRPDLAAQAVTTVAGRLGSTLEEAAAAIVAIANDRMLGGLRLVSVKRGHDPRGFALVAFGGAGPLHANALMELLGSPVCLIPPQPGVFSTFGFLVADVRRELARSHIRRLSRLVPGELDEILDELERRAREWLAAEGFLPEAQLLSWQFGMRYWRQGFELPVVHASPREDDALLDTLASGFVEAHRRAYGFELDVEPELVVVRCAATGHRVKPELRAHEPATSPVSAAIVDPAHRLWWDGGLVEAPRYARERLGAGHVVEGPCVIEQEDSTTLVHPGTRASVDEHLVLRLEAAQ